MRILAIETSCDETSIAILETDENGGFNILSNIVSSQVKIHAPFGGVVPMLAKREHQKNLVPILKQALKEAGLLPSFSHSEPPAGGEESPTNVGNQISHTRGILRSAQNDDTLKIILGREPELLKKLLPFLKKYAKLDIDLIAVTNGPGLEPALWVGVNFAKALGYFWNLPVMPVNHVEAHIAANWLIYSVIANRQQAVRQSRPITAGDDKSTGLPRSSRKAGLSRNDASSQYPNIPISQFPAICLIVSGGHTQLVLIKKSNSHGRNSHVFPLSYAILGETRDDAAGEAFDKLAKMMNLGYPGGPIVAKQAAYRRTVLRKSIGGLSSVRLPRPMINSADYDFSFSGLKTAALYFVKTLDKKTLKKLTPAICAEFQQAVVDVLVSKTVRAAKEFGARAVLLSGGVASNDLLRETLKQETEKLELKTNKLKTEFYVPPKTFCTDNAAMIALTAAIRFKNYDLRFKNKYAWQKIQVGANLRLA